MKKFTDCAKYEEINPIGNLINKTSNWDISGTMIKKFELSAESIICSSRFDLIKIEKEER